MIDVVITNYNKGFEVVRLVESFADNELVSRIIVVDDHSTDESIDRLRLINQFIGKLSLIEHKENKGRAASKFEGLMAASSPYVLLIDGDDRLESDYIAKAVPLLNDVDVVLPKILIPMSTPYNQTHGRVHGWQFIYKGKLFQLPGAIIRRELLEGVVPTDFDCCEDLPIVAQILAKGPMITQFGGLYIYGHEPHKSDARDECRPKAVELCNRYTYFIKPEAYRV